MPVHVSGLLNVSVWRGWGVLIPPPVCILCVRGGGGGPVHVSGLLNGEWGGEELVGWGRANGGQEIGGGGCRAVGCRGGRQVGSRPVAGGGGGSRWQVAG